MSGRVTSATNTTTPTTPMPPRTENDALLLAATTVMATLTLKSFVPLRWTRVLCRANATPTPTSTASDCC
jgi:hypothetical protein